MPSLTPIPPSEAELISQIIAGNDRLYRSLVERYHVGLIRYLANLVGDADMAEDIAQEAFTQAYKRLSTYRAEYAFSTWLYRIGSRLAFRQIKQHPATVDLAEIEDTLAGDTVTQPERQAERSDQAKTIRQAVTTLPPNYQQVIALYYWQELSYDEIAQVLDTPIGTIRTWLSRAKTQLRKELHGQI